MYFRGYLKIDLKGNALSRLIDQLVNAEIKMWKVKKITPDHYQAYIFAADFEKIRPIIRKRLCQIRIVEKIGLPFILNILKKRYFVLVAVSLVIAIIILSNNLVLTVNISGTEREYEIRRLLENVGIRPGRFKSEFDLDKLENKLQLEDTQIQWLDLRWQGTVLNVKVIDKKEVEKNDKVHLVANRYGVIEELIVLQGIPAVKEGDTVLPGDLLIAAPAVDEPARGIVRAKVWYNKVGEEYLQSNYWFFNNNKKKSYALKFGNYITPYYPPRPNSRNFIKYSKIKKLFRWRNLGLPIEIVNETYLDYQKIATKKNVKTVQFLAKESAWQKILLEIDSQLIIKDVTEKIYEISENAGYRVEVTVEGIEDIARQIDAFKED